MRKVEYTRWLDQRKYEANTIKTQIHRLERVEEYHGDLDEHYAKNHTAGLMDTLSYTIDHQQRDRPNPSQIPFDGNIYNNIASYRDAVKRYCRFRDAEEKLSRHAAAR